MLAPPLLVLGHCKQTRWQLRSGRVRNLAYIQFLYRVPNKTLMDKFAENYTLFVRLSFISHSITQIPLDRVVLHWFKREGLMGSLKLMNQSESGTTMAKLSLNT